MINKKLIKILPCGRVSEGKGWEAQEVPESFPFYSFNRRNVLCIQKMEMEEKWAQQSLTLYTDKSTGIRGTPD